MGLGEIFVITVNISDLLEISELTVDVQMMSWAVAVGMTRTVGMLVAVAVRSLPCGTNRSVSVNGSISLGLVTFDYVLVSM